MSIITIDQFVGVHLAAEEEVTVYFNNVTGTISFESASERSSYEEYFPDRIDGASMGSILSAAGTTKYNLASSRTSPFAVVTSTETVTPIPAQCNLKLSIVVTNETGEGLNDGSVVITATSSFGGKQVSVDDGPWIASPGTFPGLEPGTHTAYARDSNGCTEDVTFTVEAYENPFGEYGCLPQVELSPDNFSRWNAAFNPIVLCFENTPDPDKQNFRIEIEITARGKSVVGSWSPDLTGKTRCNIAGYLQGFVNANDDFKYDVLSWIDNNRFCPFAFRYRERWDSGSSIWYNGPAEFYVTFSAKQLGDLYGGNMAEYVTLLDEPAYKAKFMTLFEEPTAWAGLPFDVSYIFSEDINVPVKVRTTSLDINKQPTGVAKPSLLLANQSDYIGASASGNIAISKGQLPPISSDVVGGGKGVNRLMLAGYPAPTAEYFQVQLYTGIDAEPNYITKPLIIQTLKPCSDPYIYLKWINTLGGWDYYRFGHDQLFQLTTSDLVSIDRNVFDWENDNTIADTIKKSGINRITFGGTVPSNKVSGLKGIQTSIKVMMLVNLNPYKWHTVTINTGTFDVKRSRGAFSEFKFTISLPEINIQSQ